jgi:ribonuclease VapC
MVLDTSAIVAIVLKEPGFERLIEKIALARAIAVGTPTLLECAMVLTSRLRQDARVVVNGLIRKMNAQVIPFTEEHFETAVEAFLKFGRGRHPAALNFGDCMSYALATVAGVPLLFTGSDFARTDIAAA